MTAPRLPGFDYQDVDVEGVRIRAAVAGSGPPLLLLHGYPQTHLMWRHVAPALARTHTVVATDLRGYGDSAKPPPDTDAYAKRAMAADQVGVMARLGFERFDLVSHDRGARVAHRLALDSPDAVTRLAVLDIVPTRHVFRTAERVLAGAYFHWFFLATTGGVPEHLIGLDPDFWLSAMIDRLLGPGVTLEDDVMDEYRRAFADPDVIAATCADYRAGATVDLEHDDATFDAGGRLTCPTLALWGAKGFVGRHYAPLEVWGEYADDVRGRALPAGHFVPEEAPADTLAELQDFLGR